MREKFRSIPKPLMKQISGRFVIGGISLIVGVVMFAVSKDFIFGLPCLVLFVYLALDGGRILYCALTGKYVTVRGDCLTIEYTSIRKRVKSLIIQTEKGKMKIPVRKRIKHISVGDCVTVYMSEKARIFEQDDGLIVFGYYAIEV